MTSRLLLATSLLLAAVFGCLDVAERLERVVASPMLDAGPRLTTLFIIGCINLERDRVFLRFQYSPDVCLHLLFEPGSGQSVPFDVQGPPGFKLVDVRGATCDRISEQLDGGLDLNAPRPDDVRGRLSWADAGATPRYLRVAVADGFAQVNDAGYELEPDALIHTRCDWDP